MLLQTESELTDGAITRDSFLQLFELDVQCWPWDSFPHRLWSLEQMFSFREITLLMCAAEQIRHMAHCLAQGEDEMLPHLREWAMSVRADCQKIPLSRALRVQLEHMVEEARKEDFSLIRFMPKWDAFIGTFRIEIGEHWFLIIPKEDRWLYEQKQPIFGDPVHNGFRKAQKDISAAGRCFALDETTACVFHLMRAVESGLHAFADHMQLDVSMMEQENWKNVIDQIEKKIREMEALPKSADKRRSVFIQISPQSLGTSKMHGAIKFPILL